MKKKITVKTSELSILEVENHPTWSLFDGVNEVGEESREELLLVTKETVSVLVHVGPATFDARALKSINFGRELWSWKETSVPKVVGLNPGAVYWIGLIFVHIYLLW